jgi:hypothetical protein
VVRVGLNARVYIHVGRCRDPRVHKYVRTLVKHTSFVYARLCLESGASERVGAYPRLVSNDIFFFFLSFRNKPETLEVVTFRESHLVCADIDKSSNPLFHAKQATELQSKEVLFLLRSRS